MKKSRSKKWIIVISILTAVIIVVIIGNIVLKKIVEKKLATTLQQLSPSLAIRYSSVETNLLASAVSIDQLDIEYRPDTSSPHQHSASFSTATLSGINFFKVMAGKDVSLQKIELGKSEIILDKFLLERKDSMQDNININMPFEYMHVDKIELPNVNVLLHSTKTNKLITTGNIAILDLNIDHSQKSSSPNNINFAGIEGTLSDFSYPLPGSYYTMQIKQLKLSSEDSSLRIDSLKIIPQLGKFELGKTLGHQADHVEASIPQVEISKLDVAKLFEKKLIADEITVSKARVHIFRDRRLTRELKQQPMPADYLKKIPLLLQVNNFTIKDANVISEEFPKDGMQSGILKIEAINISMSPFINHSSQDHIEMNVKASIMGSGIIKASIYMPMQQEKSYRVKGEIENLNLPALNASAENLGKMHIESGMLNHLFFEFTASRQKATGEIIGEYHNLRIDKLKDNKEKKVAHFRSFVLQHFIMPKNKDRSMPVEKRTGKIDYPRDPTRFATFYFLKALLDGIRDSFALGFLLPQ